MDIYLERIKPLFDKSGMTVKEIAASIGCSYRDIYHWNKDGSKSYTKYLYAISKAFNVSVEYLNGETGEKIPVTTTGGGLSTADLLILDFLHSLPVERVHGILLALGAPEEVLAALGQQEPQ